MSKKEKVKEVFEKFLESVSDANSAELAYVESLKEKNKAKQQEDKGMEL